MNQSTQNLGGRGIGDTVGESNIINSTLYGFFYFFYTLSTTKAIEEHVKSLCHIE